MNLKARLLRFVHCLCCMHRKETAHFDGKCVYLGCECGRVFYGTKPIWWSL
jgi:hypothetical protein